jgi:CheY-like chemotaxis protein
MNSAPGNEKAARDGDRSTILVVDDNQQNVTILEHLLKHDYQVFSVYSGEECLEAVKTLNPDIILLDVMMPGIDGCEACRRLRADPLLRNVTVIMVSARATPSDRERGLRAGADDYVTKPISLKSLRELIRRYLPA